MGRLRRRLRLWDMRLRYLLRDPYDVSWNRRLAREIDRLEEELKCQGKQRSGRSG